MKKKITFESLSKELEEFGKEFKKLLDKAEFEAQNNIIRVPDSVVFCQDTTHTKRGIMFNNCNQGIVYNVPNKVYEVTSHPFRESDYFKLTPCNREDLRAGDIAFNSNISNWDVLNNYCIILDECIHANVYDNIHILTGINNGCLWYKVEKI